MLDFLIELGARSNSGDKRTYGVVVATVLGNIDLTGQFRVQINVPFLPGFLPWARVAVPMAGLARGTFFIPQIGDEVLVAFHHGDIHEPYVIGSLWNTIDRPPGLLPTDAVNKRKIRTPLGQEVVFDDVLQSVSITNTTQQTVSLDPAQAQMTAGLGLASVTLDTAGNITVEGAVSISLTGGISCTIKGGTVSIN